MREVSLQVNACEFPPSLSSQSVPCLLQAHGQLVSPTQWARTDQKR